jgi:hypothetical protein
MVHMPEWGSLRLFPDLGIGAFIVLTLRLLLEPLPPHTLCLHLLHPVELNLGIKLTLLALSLLLMPMSIHLAFLASEQELSR